MANMLELPKGGNAPLPSTAVHITLSWTGKAGAPECDLSALAVGENGKVGGDADFVFYNAAEHPTGTISHRGGVRGPGTETVEVDLGALPPRIDRVVLSASADGAPFARVGAMRVTVSERAGVPLVTTVISGGPETALVIVELYRRAGAWKVRAVGAGYADGLAGLARDFGIHIDTPAAATSAPATDTTPAAPRPAQATPAPAPTPTQHPRPVPAGGTDWMNPPVPAGYEL